MGSRERCREATSVQIRTGGLLIARHSNTRPGSRLDDWKPLQIRPTDIGAVTEAISQHVEVWLRRLISWSLELIWGDLKRYKGIFLGLNWVCSARERVNHLSQRFAIKSTWQPARRVTHLRNTQNRLRNTVFENR